MFWSVLVYHDGEAHLIRPVPTHLSTNEEMCRRLVDAWWTIYISARRIMGLQSFEKATLSVWYCFVISRSFVPGCTWLRKVGLLSSKFLNLLSFYRRLQMIQLLLLPTTFDCDHGFYKTRKHWVCLPESRCRLIDNFIFRRNVNSWVFGHPQLLYIAAQLTLNRKLTIRRISPLPFRRVEWRCLSDCNPDEGIP